MIRNIIKEYRLAIASSRGRPSIIEYLQAFGIEDCFSILIGGSDVSHGKPSPEPVNKKSLEPPRLTISSRTSLKSST